MRILVTGGTGTLGRQVVPLLRRAGHEVRILSRRAGGPEYVTADLASDQGIDEAVAGVEVVVHLAGGPKGDDVATRNLMRAVAKAHVRHVVYISVIGADRVPLKWFATKLAAERTVTESGVPWTILRAAQFHDLTLTVARKLAKMPIIPAPGGLRFQPVDARDVAARLVELTHAEPAGLVTDLAGPKVYTMAELVRGYLHGKRRLTLPIRLPGKAGRAYRAGENLTLDGRTGTRTWEDFLAEQAR